MVALAAQLFKGPAAMVPLILMLGVGGWVGEYILQAIGKGREAQMLKLVITFLCIAMVIKSVWDVLNQAAGIFGF
jgi:hypothetical protein